MTTIHLPRRRRRLAAVVVSCGALIAGTLAIVAANPALAAACSAIKYDVVNDWSSGHQVNVSITTGDQSVNGWTLRFDLPGDRTVQSAWNVDWSMSGRTFTGRDVGWNGAIAAGQTRELFGMTVSGNAAVPATFTLNGQTCGGSAPTTGPTATTPGTPTSAPTSAAPTSAPTTGTPSQQKQSRIPRFITQAGAETRNFRESANFVVRWGDSVDVLAWGRQRGYDDYPAWVAQHMEGIYDYYVNQVGFVNPADHTTGRQYKINLYLCGTWSNNFLPPANWAGPDEIGVGHICMPYNKTWDDWVESHEFTHVLQSYASDINRDRGLGGGFGHGNPNSGAFWEAHANYMARMKRPEVVVGSGYFGDRHHHRWLAHETYYGDWMILNNLRDTYGPRAVDRLWFEARHGEHPIDTMKRLHGWNHNQFAAFIADYASRTVVYDWTDGREIRSDIWRRGGDYTPRYTNSVTGQGGNRYRIPDNVAPQQYGHNNIQINPGSGGEVSVQLSGQSNLSGADWRFRFAAVSRDFSVRYSDTFAPGQTGTFSLRPGETHMILTVAATPSQHRNYPMELGRGERFPYELTVTGGTPATGVN